MNGDTVISILQRLIDPSQGNLPPGIADAVLAIRFTDTDLARMSELGTISNSRGLTTEEAAEYDGYIAAADLLSLWKSKARLSLKHRTSAA
jgi:hypothetical protein